MTTDAAKKVLVIDDDTTQQLLAKDYLVEAGFIVRVAQDGDRGLKLATATSPDVILLDLLLPSVNGYELCKRLKSRPETANIPVILVTGSREEDVIRRGIAAGASDFVTKPVDWEFLADRVRHVLNQAGASAATATAGHDQQGDSPDVAELRAALAEADRQIIELAAQIDELQTGAGITGTAISHHDHQAQVAEIEKQWSERLQQAVDQANKRADQRLQQLEAQFNASADQSAKLLSEMERRLAESDLEKSAVLENQRRELEAKLEVHYREQFNASETEHEAEVSRLWEFVESCFEQNLEALRRTQAGTAELRRLTVEGSPKSTIHTVLDRLDETMAAAATTLSRAGDLARRNCGGHSAEISDVILDELVRSCISDAMVRAGRHDVQVECQLPEELSMTADREALEAGIAGLVGNAIRYSPPNGAVKILGAVDGHDRIVLSVIDQGFGFDAARLKTIKSFFAAPGQQLPGSGEGAGAGLASAKQAAVIHDGSIDIDSRLGHGARVTMILQADAFASENHHADTRKAG